MLTDFNAFKNGLEASKGFSQQVAAAALSALQELDAEKLNVLNPVLTTVSTGDWQTSDNINYPVYCDIPASGVTVNDFAIVVIVDAGEEAQEIGFNALSETLGEAVRIRCKQAPKQNISVIIWILKGAQ